MACFRKGCLFEVNAGPTRTLCGQQGPALLGGGLEVPYNAGKPTIREVASGKKMAQRIRGVQVNKRGFMVAPESKCEFRRMSELLGVIAASVVVLGSMGWVGQAGMVAAAGIGGASVMMIIRWIDRRRAANRQKSESNRMMELLRILSSAVEVKNAADFGHVSRVACLAEIIGRAKGLSEHEQE